MSVSPPIPRDLWDEIPADAQAAVLALVQSIERRIAALEARLGQDSSNSSKPPSSDTSHAAPRQPKSRSGKRRGGQHGVESVGSRLLHFFGLVFARWGRHESGSVHRQTLRSYVAGLRPVVRSLLAEGAACGCPWTAKVCRKLLRAEAALWRLATVEGVPSHNNATEWASRHGVNWRKTGFGTDSDVGSRFVERMLTAVATCRQRRLDVLGFLTACLRSELDGSPAPSLLA